MFETFSMLNGSNLELLNFGSCVANSRYHTSVPRRASVFFVLEKR